LVAHKCRKESSPGRFGSRCPDFAKNLTQEAHNVKAQGGFVASKIELPTPDSARPAPDSALLVQVHIAEYAAITNRNTYYMNVSFAFWPALIVYLTLIQYLNSLKPGWSLSLTVSLAAIGSELITWGWYFCVVEQYKNVRYIETTLKPMLRQLLGTKEFWGYETERHSPTDIQWQRVIGDVWACVLVLLPAGCFSWKWSPTNRLEWAAFIFSLFTGAGLLWLTAETWKERRKFEKGLRGLG
jgi:hypothetical protein